MTTKKSAVAIAILILIIAVVGNMSLEDEQKEQEYYCKMVHDGVWPDYNDAIRQGICPGEKTDD